VAGCVRRPARDGRPHSSGQRPYGYAPDAVTIIEAEAVIIREVYARCLEGASSGQIARELNERGEVTVSGQPWQPYAVRSVLTSPTCGRHPGVP
jgi:site-specific DNA recombinase